ncbi:FLYWCH-type zinc finger-containing protein 1-like isoform X2 [Eurosta solidaginis]|uniref:FLYWCH-type zinc finger-containing protein 1-like isoform X2 n=1 Tax=Eurosta solidaginis TaxID=178769 RepID=UPI00353123CE
MKIPNYGLYRVYTVTLNSTDGRDCQIRKKRASSTSAASNPYVMPFPSGQWLENPDIYYLRNQKQGYNLIFQGFMYKKEASFRSTINWICSNGNGRRVSDNKCAARCITNWEGALKLDKDIYEEVGFLQRNIIDVPIERQQPTSPQPTTQAQQLQPHDHPPQQQVFDGQGPVFVESKYGTKQLVLKQHTFNRHVSREDVTYWRCSQFAVLRCRARIKTKGTTLTVLNSEHNHEVITKARKYGSLKAAAAASAACAQTAAASTHTSHVTVPDFDCKLNVAESTDTKTAVYVISSIERVSAMQH